MWNTTYTARSARGLQLAMRKWLTQMSCWLLPCVLVLIGFVHTLLAGLDSDTEAVAGFDTVWPLIEL